MSCRSSAAKGVALRGAAEIAEVIPEPTNPAPLGRHGGQGRHLPASARPGRPGRRPPALGAGPPGPAARGPGTGRGRGPAPSWRPLDHLRRRRRGQDLLQLEQRPTGHTEGGPPMLRVAAAVLLGQGVQELLQVGLELRRGNDPLRGPLVIPGRRSSLADGPPPGALLEQDPAFPGIRRHRATRPASCRRCRLRPDAAAGAAPAWRRPPWRPAPDPAASGG